MRRARMVLCVPVVIMAIGCRTIEEGTMLEIINSPTPNEQCIFAPEAQFFRARGFYDPTFNGGIGMQLALSVANNLESEDADPTTSSFPNDRPVRPIVNAVSLIGFDVCWYRAEDIARFGSFSNGVPVDCEQSGFPESQRGFRASSGQIEPNGGRAIVLARVLDLPALRGVFGQSFDPSQLATRVTTSDSLGRTLSYWALESNATDPPHPAWGSFPAGQSITDIIVQLRAVGKTQVGQIVRSNWFLHPVELCPGCLLNACGVLVEVNCTGGGRGFEGQEAVGGCLPEQDFVVGCADVSTCD